jgi:tripartite-type tricarboxylate transporter receptor subunit TctC
MAPVGTPQPIVDLLNREINKILSRPDVIDSWEKLGAHPVAMLPPEFGAFVQSEIEKWEKIIKANAIRPE